MTAAGQRHVALTAALPPGWHTVVITSTAGTIGVDGIAVRQARRQCKFWLNFCSELIWGDLSRPSMSVRVHDHVA
jgi:hypothetical protein